MKHEKEYYYIISGTVEIKLEPIYFQQIDKNSSFGKRIYDYCFRRLN